MKLIILMVVFFNCTSSAAQDAIMLKHLVIGTWTNEVHSSDKYIFSSNGDCVHYFGSPFKYKYSITKDPKDCDPDKNRRRGDTTVYIRLYDTEEKSVECFVINGLSRKYLSIRRFGDGGTRLYLRQERKSKNRSKY